MMTCSSVGSAVRFLCLIALWGVVSWPVWAITISNVHYRVLDLLPFVVNCLGLIGTSYEAESLDWRIWALNMCLAGALSLASSLNFHRGFEPAGIAVIAVGTAISLIGVCCNIQDKKHLFQDFDRKITVIKVVAILIICGLTIWGILVWKDNNIYMLLSQLLIGGSVACACAASLVFVADRKKVGVGSPLLWLFLRILLSAGVECFWIWAILCLGSFSFLNCLHKRVGLFGALRNHWLAWQRIERFCAGVSLTGSFALLFLVLNGRTATLRVTPSSQYLNARAALSVGPFLQDDCSNPAPFIWRSMALDGLNQVKSLILNDDSSPRSTTRQQWMFEESACVAMVALLLISGAAGYLRKLKDPRSSQGFWQPVFFFVTAVMVVITSHTKYETIAYIAGWLDIEWADDSLMAVSLGLVFFVFSFLVSAYSVKNDQAERAGTPFKNIKTVRLRFAGIVLISIMFLVALLCFLQFSFAFARERPVYHQFDGGHAGFITNRTNNNRTEVIKKLVPFLSNENKIILEETGLNCSDITACMTSIFAMDSVGVCNQTYELETDAINILVRSSLSYQMSFGLSDLLSKEILALAILTLSTVLILCAGLCHPVMDDLGLIMTGITGAVMTIAVPYRIKELRGFEQGMAEWFIPTLALFQLVSSCVSLLIRVESPMKFINPWTSLTDFEIDFATSPFDDVAEFATAYSGCIIEGHDTKSVFQCLVEHENTKCKTGGSFLELS